MAKNVSSSVRGIVRRVLIAALVAIALTLVTTAAAKGYLTLDNFGHVMAYPAAPAASFVTDGAELPSILTASLSKPFLFGGNVLGIYTVVNTNDAGPGSLRDAIAQANASADDDTIDFLIPGCAPATPCTITLTTGELPVANNGLLSITGPGAPVLTISGNNQSRILNIALDATISVNDLSLTAGKAPDAVVGTPAAHGGAIFSQGTLTVSNATVSASFAGNGRSGGGSTESNGGAGGAVYSTGALTLDSLTLANNRAGTGGSGLDCFGSCGSTFASGDGGNGGGIYSTGTLTINNLTATGNLAGNGGGGANTFVGDIGGPGGKGGNGGAIYNSGASFQMTGSTLTNNFAGTGGQGGVAPPTSGSPLGTYGGFGGDGGLGGAIYNAAGTAVIATNIINSNHAGNAGNAGRGMGGGFTGNSGFGGVGGGGGGVFNAGTLTLTDSTVSTNTAGTGGKNGEAQNATLGVAGGDGGGIYTQGSLTLTGSTISGNTAGGGGQGSFANNGGRGGDGGRGGGLYTKTVPVTMANTTVSGNIAGAGGRGGNCFGFACGHSQGGPGGEGGGVYNGFSMELTNLTISNNTTGAGGQGGNDTNGNPGVFAANGAGGGVRSAGSTTNLRNAIIAKNIAAGTVNKDVQGSFTSRGHNFIGQKDGGTGLTDGVNADQVGTNASPKDPQLGPLQNNGGPAATHNLPPGSPAVGTGDNCVLTANGCLDGNPAVGTDQRGLIRPQGAVVDIGAVEAFTSIPNAPDLVSDTGTSSTDNLTNAATLEFQVTGATPAASLELLRGAVVVSISTADAGGIANFSYTDAAADGVYSFTARYAISGVVGTSSSGLSVTVDRSSPNVNINQAAGQADPANALPVNYTVSFSEPVTGFASSGVSLTGTAGNIGGATVNITGAAATYNVAVTNLSATGTVQANIIAAAAADAAGNANLASTSGDNLVTYDITLPTVTIVQAVGQADPTSGLPIAFTVTFSEAVTGFTNSDVLLTGSTANVSAAVIGVTGSGALYNLTIGNVTASGTVLATIPANAAIDAAGNLSTASSGGDNVVTYDLPAPTVTVDQSAAQIDPTNQQPINFTIVFSEPVTGFTNTDVSLAGSTANVAGASIVVTGSGTTYNAAVGNITSSGTLQASIPAGGAINVDGDVNTASTSTDNIVTLDITPPAVTIDQAVGQSDPASTEPVVFAAQFSEPVTGFAAADVLLTGSTADVSGAVINVTGTGAVYSVAVSNIRSSGTVIASMTAGAAADTVGNVSLASTSTDNVVTFNVASTSLVVNLLGDGGDGVCDATCTLRDAILTSNATTGVKNITFNLPACLPASPCISTLTAGELSVNNTGALNITGPGAGALSISGNSTGRVFNLAQSSLVSMSDLSIVNGRAPNGANGGAILNAGTLSLSNISVTGSSAGNGADGPFASGAAGSVGGHGGGIFNNGGAVTLTNCALAGNNAGTAGNGSNGFGTGSIGNGGTGGSGGGIFNNAGTVTIRNSTLGGNNAGTGGNPGAQTNGLRIGDGGDGGHGGGFYSTGGAVVIGNSTFSGNNAGSGQTGLGFQGQHGGNGGNGGALYQNSGTVLMINTTVNINHAGNAGPGDFGASSGAGGSGGGILLSTGTVKLRNTIVAGNTAPQNGPDLFGTFATLGHNFIGRSDGSTGFTDGAAGDKVGNIAVPKDALLGLLQNNGGPTQTHNPAAISPVREAGDNCVLDQSCPVDNFSVDLTVDQRGAPRPQGAMVDIGSVEVIAAANAPDLLNVSDSGISPTDNLTKEINLQFQVGGAIAGATVQLLKNGMVAASSTADGGGVANLTFTDNSADGTYNFASQQVISGAASPPSASLPVTIDRTAPAVTVEQAAGQADPASAQPVNFMVTFDGSVGGFADSDISLAGSTADVSSANVVVTGTWPVYNVAIGNILQAGTVIASLPAAGATDDAGNGNAASTSSDNIVTISIPRPSVDIDQAAGQADPTNVLPVNYTVVFSVPVTGLSSSGISLAGSTAGVGGATINVTGSGTTYNVAIGGVTSGNLVVAVSANAANGLGGGNLASTSTDNTVTYDTAPPAVTIDQAGPQADPTSAQPINFTAVFNRPVTGFGPGGISLAGSTADVSGATVTITGAGPAYNVTVGNIQSSGIVRASVLAGAASGLGGATTASTSTDNEVTITGNTLVVNLTSDDGDETCDATCTLRDAVNNANASPGFDDITFNLPSCTGAPACTVTLTKGPFFPGGNGEPLTIATGSSISIHGPGIAVLAVDGNSAQTFNSTRVFTVQPGARLSVTDLTITNGTASDFEFDTNYRGGGIYNGGGDVSVSNVLFTGNRARIGFQGGFSNSNQPGTAGSEGGAIYNASGTINVSNCTFTANSGGNGGLGGGSSTDTGTGPGGPGGPGGAIYNAATMTVIASTFNNNTAGAGGAPGNRNNNNALPRGTGGNGGNGGAIYNTGTLFLINSTLSGNTGGAGTNGGQNGNGGNSGSGGGLVNAGGSIVIVNSTMSNNAVAAAGIKGTLGVQNGTVGSGGGLIVTGGVVLVRNTIIAKNSVPAGGVGLDALGAFATLGHNLIGKSDGTTGFADGVNFDQVGTIAAPKDPLLGALISNGGPTQTLALATGSTARNAGDNCVLNASCVSNNLAFSVTTDQRGQNRQKGPAVDIGAFELDLAAATVGLTSSHNPSLTGQPVTFTSTVTGAGTPTGSVTFLDGGVSITGCTGVTLTAGVATCFAPTLTFGSHTVTAQYSGDGNFNPATINLGGGPQVVTNTATWTGAVNTDWNNPANWGSDFVPLATHDVVLPATGVTNQPAIPAGDLIANNLDVAAGRTLNITGGNLTINGILTMNGGDITVGTGSLLTLGSGASVTRTSGSVIGNIRKDFAAPETFIYPVGTATGYSPVDATVTAGTGSLTIKANVGTAPANPALNPAIVIQRYWTLTGGGITADITWHYLQTDVPGTANEALFSIMRIVGGGPVEAFLPNGSTRIIDTAGNTFTMKGMSVFSNWLVGVPSAPTAAHVNVSGRVLDARGRGLSQALVAMADTGGNTIYAVTNPFGYYHFRDVAAGDTYIFGVINKRFVYAPRAVTITDEMTGLDFVPGP